ncbi:MAG: HlyD family secretion protein [Chitinophagaceae bacterium]
MKCKSISIRKTYIPVLIAVVALFSCNSNDMKHDATGVFEADEVIVSAEVGGKILSFFAQEGDTLSIGRNAAVIDATNLSLQKEQVEESIKALREKTNDVQPQIRLLEEQIHVQQSQLATLEKEKLRFEKLVKADAATPKQLDDIDAQLDLVRKQINVTQQQIAVQKSQVGTQNRSVLSEEKPLQKRAAQLEDQVLRSNVINPVGGTVLITYVHAGEVTGAGKPLYKIADLSSLFLRAYITGQQLLQVKPGQQVSVLVDDGVKTYKTYFGTITWISDKAEFTPKTIQTKEERANLVYAMKVRVPNDGYLKIGMYGEVLFKK